MNLQRARELIGSDLLSLDDVAAALGVAPTDVDPAWQSPAASVPFSELDLDAARANGLMLIFRVARVGPEPVTINWLIQRLPAAFDPQLLAKVGYLLRDEWGITIEPLAKSDTCQAGWALVHKAPLPTTCNVAYFEQDIVLQHLGPHWARRTAVEAAFDLAVYHACRGVRLLPNSFDWTSSMTVDSGYLNVGGFGNTGMALVGFSPAIRHATLGVCPTRSR